MDWQWAAKQFQIMLDRAGVEIEWLQRATSGSEAYDTGSEISYGYGDPARFWTTGSVKAIVQHVRVEDVVIPQGFYPEDFKKIFVPLSTPIEYWDQVIYPSGSGERYIIHPVHSWVVGGVTIAKYATIRKLVPHSQGEY
jgi:hypothetical protein